jgi:hypothetical protein
MTLRRIRPLRSVTLFLYTRKFNPYSAKEFYNKLAYIFYLCYTNEWCL